MEYRSGGAGWDPGSISTHTQRERIAEIPGSVKLCSISCHLTQDLTQSCAEPGQLT